MKSINFKPLTENDLVLLFNWFQKPYIKQWYARGENYTLGMIREKYLPRILNPEPIPNFIVYADNTPIGYIQLYCVKDSLSDGVTTIITRYLCLDLLILLWKMKDVMLYIVIIGAKHCE